MTIAERLRQEGFQNGQSQIILKQLKKRFGYLSPALERKLNESRVDVLDPVGESIFDFESLEDAEIRPGRHLQAFFELKDASRKDNTM